MNELFNVLHVVTAVFIVGPLAILPMTALRALRSGNGAQVATLATSTSVLRPAVDPGGAARLRRDGHAATRSTG